MHPLLASCQFLLDGLAALVTGVRGDAMLSGGPNDWLLGADDKGRPRFAPRPFARRLAAGLRLIEAYLRRILLIFALQIEPTLVDNPKPMRRPHRRKALMKPPRFKVLKDHCDLHGGAHRPALRSHLRLSGDGAPSRVAQPPVAMGRLFARLDLLTAIAADPMPRARRLAFHLARSRPGPILAPDRALRASRRLSRHVRHHWRSQASIVFSSMGAELLERSRSRPPPLAAIRTYGPSIIMLGG